MTPPAQEPFQICLLINTQGEDQRSLATELRQIIISSMVRYPGFIRADIQLCDDQHHLMELCSWQSREDYQHYRQSADGQHGALWIEPYQPQVFHLRPFIQIDNSL